MLRAPGLHLSLLHYGLIPNILYHLIPLTVILKMQLLLRFLIFAHMRWPFLSAVLQQFSGELFYIPPWFCCTAVISHLFSVPHKSCVGHAERSSSVPPYHWKRGVFPRVILIYSSIQPAHCCLSQLWSSSIQLDPRFSPSLSYITPPILHAPHLFPEVRFGIGWECVQWY